MRPAIFGPGLEGFDFYQIHGRHIAFARDGLFGAGHSLPGWYPPELFGAPFWANIQSFPWIPSRLLLLLLSPKLQYLAGVAIAAALAAIFTYLYARRLGLSEIAAISAAWTFSCAGFFASRVMSGELPLLEAYPSLPVLLWLADRAVSPERLRFQARDLTALALVCACFALAGHPQLPAYSIGAAVLYLLIRGRGRRRVLAIASVALGLGLTLFAWWPMLLLIERSTRVLPLAPPANDIAMPYGRLLALIWPGREGWPEIMRGENDGLFTGYPNVAYFWDTVSYVGLLPLIALLFLALRLAWKRRLPDGKFAYLAGLGIGALLLSMPVMQPLHHVVHATLFRSPARLLYLSTFCGCMGLACGVDALLTTPLRRRIVIPILALCLTTHAFDLGTFARRFIWPADPQSFPPEFAAVLDQQLGDARIAAADPAYREHYDDAGIYDSILLANPYRALLERAGLPRDLNEQRVDASTFPLRALKAAGVRFVVTPASRDDLECVARTEDENLYRVRNPAPRVSFFRGDPDGPFGGEWPPDPSQAPAPHAAAGQTQPEAQVNYFRTSSDEIRIEAHLAVSGFVTVLESYDAGWSATMDGKPARVMLANGFAISVPAVAGRHSIVMRYRTPGAREGILLSLASAGLLAAFIAYARRFLAAD